MLSVNHSLSSIQPNREIPWKVFALGEVLLITGLALAVIGGTHLFGTHLDPTRIALIAAGSALFVSSLFIFAYGYKSNLCSERVYEQDARLIKYFLKNEKGPLSPEEIERLKSWSLKDFETLIKKSPGALKKLWELGLITPKNLALVLVENPKLALDELCEYLRTQPNFSWHKLVEEVFSDAEKKITVLAGLYLAFETLKINYQKDWPSTCFISALKDYAKSKLVTRENAKEFSESLCREIDDQSKEILVSRDYRMKISGACKL